MMIQDIYRNEPWKMLICCFLLNRSTGVKVKEIMRNLFNKYKTVDDFALADVEILAKDIEVLGFQNKKAETIKNFCAEFEEDYPLSSKGIGKYAKDSYEVFINRNIKTKVEDVEILKYLQKIREGSSLKDSSMMLLKMAGKSRKVSGKNVVECLNGSYHFDDSYFFNLTEDQKDYVEKKLKDYDLEVEKCCKKLIKDESTRQAVIQFDVSSDLPNCTVSIQFQVRDNVLNVSVFQRSQDVDKIEMDCEIFSRMACKIVSRINADQYFVKVFVGNLHYYL